MIQKKYGTAIYLGMQEAEYTLAMPCSIILDEDTSGTTR